MEQLKRWREQRGLSQTKLAARADVNPATVNQIEGGKRTASPATLHKLADALDVSLYELLEGEVAPKAEAPSSSGGKGAITSVAEQTLFEHVNMLKAAANKWQLFIDREYYDLKSMDLKVLGAINTTDLNIVIVHSRHAAAIKRKATDEQRELLEQASQRLLDTINTFWSAAEPYLTVTDLATVRAQREELKQASASDPAGSQAG